MPQPRSATVFPARSVFSADLRFSRYFPRIAACRVMVEKEAYTVPDLVSGPQRGVDRLCYVNVLAAAEELFDDAGAWGLSVWKMDVVCADVVHRDVEL